MGTAVAALLLHVYMYICSLNVQLDASIPGIQQEKSPRPAHFGPGSSNNAGTEQEHRVYIRIFICQDRHVGAGALPLSCTYQVQTYGLSGTWYKVQSKTKAPGPPILVAMKRRLVQRSCKYDTNSESRRKETKQANTTAAQQTHVDANTRIKNTFDTYYTLVVKVDSIKHKTNKTRQRGTTSATAQRADTANKADTGSGKQYREETSTIGSNKTQRTGV